MERTRKQARPRKVSVSVLPDFDLHCGDRRVVAVPTAERLIAFLALQGGRRLRRGYVSGVLWGDVPQHRANGCLRSAVWRAPTCRGLPVVEASSSHVWLHPGVVVDLARARNLARRLLDAGHVEPSRLNLRRVVALLSEDLLVGWYDEWAILERERFRLLRIQALEELADLLLRDDCPRLALRVAAAAVAAEPLRESSQRLLVRAHLAEGNLVDALRQYASYADQLASELGVRPSAAMEQLVTAAVGNGSSETGSSAWLTSLLSRPLGSEGSG